MSITLRAVLGYCKLCELEDFADRDLLRYAAELFDTNPDAAVNFTRGHEHRKGWEIAQAARALAELGALGRHAEVLGVAAGIEATIYWATNRARRVFATDLYFEPGDWEDSAPRDMLTIPGMHASGPWNPRRLVVQHMDALALEYDDDSFDGVFCTSSIEHYGDHYALERAVAEIWRVLKPGGIATLTTEYRLEGPGPGLPGTLLLDAAELDELIIKPHAWRLVEPLDTHLSEATLTTELPLDDSVDRYPHVVLRHGQHLFTSVQVTLRKQRSLRRALRR
jgi:SAM-dependent methyltransferase